MHCKIKWRYKKQNFLNTIRQSLHCISHFMNKLPTNYHPILTSIFFTGMTTERQQMNVDCFISIILVEMIKNISSMKYYFFHKNIRLDLYVSQVTVSLFTRDKR